eukprot:844313_1
MSVPAQSRPQELTEELAGVPRDDGSELFIRRAARRRSDRQREVRERPMPAAVERARRNGHRSRSSRHSREILGNSPKDDSRLNALEARINALKAAKDAKITALEAENAALEEELARLKDTAEYRHRYLRRKVRSRETKAEFLKGQLLDQLRHENWHRAQNMTRLH